MCPMCYNKPRESSNESPFCLSTYRKGKIMKKTVSQIFMLVGFVVLVLGMAIANAGSALVAFTNTAVMAVFAVACIFASSDVIKNIGYALAAIVAADGFAIFSAINIEDPSIGMIIASAGAWWMGLSALLYALLYVLKLFGFVFEGQNAEVAKVSPVLDEIATYKKMMMDGILTEEEYNDLKQKVLDEAQTDEIPVTELKKLKKLLDKQIITEEEFAQYKEVLFKK